MDRRVASLGTGLFVAALTLTPAFAQPDSRSPLLTSEENEVLDRVRLYATNYTASLPNFICIQNTRRMIAEAKGKPWKPIDEISQKLNFVSGRETYELISEDRPKKRAQTPLSVISRGEFGTLMRMVLVLDSANFGWLGWDRVQGQKVAVFTYRVPLDKSAMRLEGNRMATIVAFHGLVFAQPETGAVYRITTEAEGLPHELAFQRMGSDIEYGPVTIADASYLLPAKIILSAAAGSDVFKNEAEFRDYKKFGSESTITFPKEPN